MNCARCQHEDLIEKAKACCRECDPDGRRSPADCERKCPNPVLIGQARTCCASCDPDSLSHHGASHVEVNDFTLAQRKDRGPEDGREILDAITMRRLLKDILTKAEAARPDGSAGVFLSSSDFDAIRTFFEDEDPEMRRSRQDERESATFLTDEAREQVLKLLQLFRSLDLNTLEVLHGLINGACYRQIAKRLGFDRNGGRATIQARINSAFKRFPWMKAFVDSFGRARLPHQRSHNRERALDWQMNEDRLKYRTRYVAKSAAIHHPLPEIDGPEYGEHPGEWTMTGRPRKIRDDFDGAAVDTEN